MNKFLYFLIGAGIGSAITYISTKNYFAKKADEEIASIREYYRQKSGDTEAVEEPTKEEIIAENARMKPEMDSIIKNYSAVSTTPEVEEPKITPGHEPYVIDEERFDEIYEGIGKKDSPYEDYDIMTSYRYFGNGVLVNSRDEVVDMPTVAKFVGLGNLRQLSMQDDDIIYIRNDVYKCAYEIIREEEDYIDPHIEG